MDWALPDKNVYCLIGRGDSTKSTILEALRRLFHPYWNLAFDDADFYQCVPANTITIEAILGDIPDSFCDLAAYGHWLCGWNRAELRRENDPGEGLEEALRARLSIGNDLEPSWRVIKSDEDEGVPFKANDRAKAAVTLIGAFSDRHLTWSKGSVLSQLTAAENISSSLAEAARAAKAALETRRGSDLAKFDEVATKAEETARALGVGISSTYKAHLDSDAINVRIGGLALHDGDLPLRQLGLGSKRMLMTGLQKQVLHTPHITLFDEVEVGLEPHRIARLLHHLQEDKTGQYFLTSHSPVVLRELTVDDLHVVHCRNGTIEVVDANKPAIADFIQGKIRERAEAFLAPKIVVCEGSTEVGFLRGLDRYWVAKGELSLAYQGVAPFDANGGSKVKGVAHSIKELSYDVAIIADSDRPEQFSDTDAAELNATGILVVKWRDGLSLEERVVSDLPWSGVIETVNTALALHKNESRLLDQIGSQYGGGFDRNRTNWMDTPRLRQAIGKAANASEWFKRQDRAQDWALAISPSLDDQSMQESDLVTQLKRLRSWVDRV